MLLAVDLHEDFIDVERVAIAWVLALPSTGINSTEFYTSEAYRFSGYSDTSLGQEIFNIPVAQIEAIAEPDGVADDVRRDSMSLVCIEHPILSIKIKNLLTAVDKSVVLNPALEFSFPDIRNSDKAANLKIKLSNEATHVYKNSNGSSIYDFFISLSLGRRAQSIRYPRV